MENEYVELAKTQKPLKGSMPRAGAPLLVKCIKSLQKPICISADGLRWRPGDYQNANMAQSGSKTYLKCPQPCVARYGRWLPFVGCQGEGLDCGCMGVYLGSRSGSGLCLCFCFLHGNNYISQIYVRALWSRVLHAISVCPLFGLWSLHYRRVHCELCPRPRAPCRIWDLWQVAAAF